MSEQDISELLGDEGIDADEAENLQGDFEPLPAGWYSVEVEAFEIKDTKDKKGKYVKLTLCVISEGFSGRKVFPMHNILNQNETAEKIGRAELGSLAKACGLAKIRNNADVIGAYVDVRLVVKPGKGDYGPDNRVKEYAPLGQGGTKATKKAGGAAPARQSVAKPAAKAPAAGGGKMPWEQ